MSGYTPIEVAFARDGTPVFGFETEVARERSARRVAERLVEYATYDVAVRYGDREPGPSVAGSEGYQGVTRHRLRGPAYDRLDGAYLRLGNGE